MGPSKIYSYIKQTKQKKIQYQPRQDIHSPRTHLGGQGALAPLGPAHLVLLARARRRADVAPAPLFGLLLLLLLVWVGISRCGWMMMAMYVCTHHHAPSPIHTNVYIIYSNYLLRLLLRRVEEGMLPPQRCPAARGRVLVWGGCR